MNVFNHISALVFLILWYMLIVVTTWLMFVLHLFLTNGSYYVWSVIDSLGSVLSVVFGYKEDHVLENLTTGYTNTTKRRDDNRPCKFAVDNMANLIGQETNQSENEISKETKTVDSRNHMGKGSDRPIINGVSCPLSDDDQSTKVTDLRLETVKNKTTWQQMSPRRERKFSRQNSSGSSASGASGSAGSNSNSMGSNSIGSNSSTSPTGSPTKSWKSIRESNKNTVLSWKDLSPKNSKQNCNSKPESSLQDSTDTETKSLQTSPTKRCCGDIQNELNNKIHSSPDHVCAKSACKCTEHPQNSPEHKYKESYKQYSSLTNQNELNKQLSPEHANCKHKDLCRNSSGDDGFNNDYFYDEDFTVQFDTNLRESSPGLNCTCIDPAMMVDFPHMITGSYLSFNNMKGSGALGPTNSQDLFCPDESELSSCRNSAMDMSSSEREMMCSSDMLDFSDNPIFTPSPTRDMNGQNVSTDSLDRKLMSNGHAPGCQNSMELSTSRTSSDGNLCVNCCPRKEEYFLSYNGSQGCSGSNSENDNSMTSLGSGQGHWVPNSSGEDIAEECSDSFHFCYMMNGNQNLIPPPSHKRKKFQSLKAVQENSLEEREYSGEDSRENSPSPRHEIRERQCQRMKNNCKISCNHEGSHGASPHRSRSSGSSSLRSRKPTKNVTSWKQVKSLKKLGKLDSNFDPTRSHSMPELYYEAWHSFSSQDCRDLAKIAESFHSKRHSAYLLDLYQRVRNQSNPVSPDTMAGIEQILFHPLLGRCQGEANLSADDTKCCTVCGHKKEDSHSSHTLTNSNVQQLINTSRSGQPLDYYTKKRIIDWLERDKLDGKSKSCQTGKEKKTTETVISPTTVTLWCGTKNFGSQFPPMTKDCGIQAEECVKEKLANVEQQTSTTDATEKKSNVHFGQQTSPIIDREEILSLLPETFKDLDDIMPRKPTEKCSKPDCFIPRSKSADPSLMTRHENKLNSYYTYKSLPELNFITLRSDLEHKEHFSIFDPLPVQMPIPVFIPTTDLSKSKDAIVEKAQQACGHKSRQDMDTNSKKTYQRSRSAPSKLSNPNLLKHIGESGSSSSGFSTSSTSSGIDTGYSSESRAFQNGSPSNDIERLLFFPPHVELSTKAKPDDQADSPPAKLPQLVSQGLSQHIKLMRLSDRKVNKYANETHPSTIDSKSKLKMTPVISGENPTLSNKSASDSNLHMEHLYALQEENTPVSSPDQHCHHKCCNGSDCFYAYNRPTYSIELGENYYEGHENDHIVLRRKFDYHCQVSSESGSSTSSGIVLKAEKKPLKSCLRKKQILRSRSLSDQFNMAQQVDVQKQKRKLNRHSYACEEVYLLTDESGQYYLCQSDNLEDNVSQESEPEPALFHTKNVEPANQQPVKLRRKKSQEPTTDGEKDNLSGKRKSVSFASEVSFHAISPQMSPKHQGKEQEEDMEVDVESIEEDCAVSTDENPSDESDTPPQEFKLSPPASTDTVYDERFTEIEKKKAMLSEVCQIAELLVNHFNKAKNPFDKLRLGSSADNEEIGNIVLNKLCPALSQVIGDGLKPHLSGFQMFGRIQVNVWKVAELSAEQGPYTRAIHDLVQQLKGNPSLLSSNTKFEAFLFGLLNLRLLDYWMGYLRYNESLTEKFYNIDGVIVLGKSCYERSYDEMLIALQPLAILPFQLGVEYVIENSIHQHRSPSHSPIKNKPSPGTSPTSEKKAMPPNCIQNSGDVNKAPLTQQNLTPPPKPARMERPINGLISNKAWEWLKGSPSVKNEENSTSETRYDSQERELFIDEDKLKDDPVLDGGDKVEKSPKTAVPMTESFTGIAHKLLGLNLTKEKNVASSGNLELNGSNSNISQMEEEIFGDKQNHLTRQNSVESVSNKAKSGLIKLFDKLLLSRDGTQKQPESVDNKKSSSWNFGFNPTEKSKSMIPTSKSLSPVHSNSFGKLQSGNDVKVPTKTRPENVVAKSIQKEAKRSSKAQDIRKQKTVIASLLKSDKIPTKKFELSEPESPSKRVIKPGRQTQKLETKDGMESGNQIAKKANDKKVSKIPTLKLSSPSSNAVKQKEKSGTFSKIPKRHSLVLDSSGSEVGSPSSSTVCSPVKVKHSKSADFVSGIPSAQNSPARKGKLSKEKDCVKASSKLSSFKSVESSEIKNSIELVRFGQKFGSKDKHPDIVDDKIIGTKKNIDESKTSGEISCTSSDEQCASLELGPTLVVPPSIQASWEKSEDKESIPKTAETPTSVNSDVGKTEYDVSSEATDVELDINSNSPLSVIGGNTTSENVFECPANYDCSAKQDSGDFSKPNFRYIQTLESFDSSETSQLSYRKGEHYEVLAQIDSSWFYCVNGSKEGLIHTGAVQPLTEQDEFDTLHSSFYS